MSSYRGGGADTSVVTAGANDVLKGKVIVNANGDPINGQLELTGNASTDDVVKGKTFYNTNAKDKQTGTLELIGDASEANVLEGKTFYNNDPQTIRLGTMLDNGAQIHSLNAGQRYTIPAGYHNGGGYITANSLASQTPATAVTTDIIGGRTAWVNGALLTGNMVINSVVSFNVAVTGSSTVTATWIWPARGPYSGVCINCKTGGYPVNPWDGQRVYTGTGSNHVLGSASSVAIGGLQGSTTYYFSIWVYCSTSPHGDMFSSQYNTGPVTTHAARGQQAITSSGMFTVPAGIYSIDIFMVSGGTGGDYSPPEESSVYRQGGSGGGSATYGVFTHKGIAVSPGQQIPVTIGGGGSSGDLDNRRYPNNGGKTSFGSYHSADKNVALGPSYSYRGGSSSGGLKGIYRANYDKNGEDGGSNGGVGKVGCGKTTRAFGEANNTLYAGGGGGGCTTSMDPVRSGYGGAGGRGNGGGYGTPGTPNTGGGGGGANFGRSLGTWCVGTGGSGVVLVRWGY